MAARLVGNPDQQFFKNDGSINAGGTLTFYEPGTTTPKTIYSTSDTGGATHTNPHTLDSAGRPTAPIFTDGLYDILVKDSAGSTLVSVSNYGDNNSAVATDLSNLVQNASFETDATADGVADGWTETEHANITIARSTTAPAHGAAHQRFTVSGAGTASCLSTLFEVSALTTLKGSMLLDTSSAGLQVKVYLSIYDSAQSLLSSQAIYSSTTNPTSYAEKQFSDITVGDHESTGRYAALKLEVSDNSTTGTVDFDGIEFYRTATASAVSITPSGLLVSIDTDTAHDLNFTAGSAKDSSGTYDLILASEITKQIDATWAAGDDAGGWESGSSIPTSGIFYIWLIGSSTTGAVDVLYSLSATAPTLPSGYDKKRRIFSWVTDASNNLIPASHDGIDKLIYDENVLLVYDTTLTTNAWETITAACPANGEYYFNLNLDSDPNGAWTFGTVMTRKTGATAAQHHQLGFELTGGTFDEVLGEGWQNVDASSQFDYKVGYTASAGTMEVTIATIGFRDIGRNII